MRGPLRKPLFRFHPHTWTVWMMATPLLMGVALFFDFFPREGPPAFDVGAVTGKTPVFNLGWPIVTSAYVPSEGFRLGPLAWPVFLAQLLLYAACTGVVWAWRHAANRTLPEGSDTP